MYLCMYVCVCVCACVCVCVCVWIGQETSEGRKRKGGLLTHYKGQGQCRARINFTLKSSPTEPHACTCTYVGIYMYMHVHVHDLSAHSPHAPLWYMTIGKGLSDHEMHCLLKQSFKNRGQISNNYAGI